MLTSSLHEMCLFLHVIWCEHLYNIFLSPTLCSVAGTAGAKPARRAAAATPPATAAPSASIKTGRGTTSSAAPDFRLNPSPFPPSPRAAQRRRRQPACLPAWPVGSRRLIAPPRRPVLEERRLPSPPGPPPLLPRRRPQRPTDIKKLKKLHPPPFPPPPTPPDEPFAG